MVKQIRGESEKIKEYIEKFGLKFYIIEGYRSIKRAIKSILKYDEISFDIETSGFSFREDDLLGIVIGVSEKKAIYLNFRNLNFEDSKDLIKLFKEFNGKIYGWNFYFDKSFKLGKYNIDINFTDDGLILSHTMFAHKRLYGESLSLKAMTNKYLPYKNYNEYLEEKKKSIIKEKNILTKEFDYSMFSDELLSEYGCMDGIATFILTKQLIKEANKRIKSDWKELKEVLRLKYSVNEQYIKAKVRGMKIDRDKVFDLKKEWSDKKDFYLNKINKNKAIKIFRAEYEEEFNPNSSKQLRYLFYKILDLDVIETTKKGNPSTDSYVLEYYNDIPLIADIEKFKLYSKGIDGFLEGKRGLIHLTTENHSYVHPNANITGTISSRTATSNPNLGQIPSRGELKKIKKCYTPRDGYKFLSFDFASAELRILGHLSQEPNFIDAFKKGLNLHSLMAIKIFGDKMDIPSNLSLKEKCDYVKKNYGDTYRYYVKSVNFGLPYSISEYGLSKNIRCTIEEAKKLLDNYKENNKKIKEFMDYNLDFASENLYVEDILGQRLYLPAMHQYKDMKENRYYSYKISKEAKKTTNFRIQASNAIILYEGMDTFFKEIEERDLDIHLFTTIYDAVYCEVNKNIDNKVVFDLFKKHFVKKLDENVTLDIDIEKTKGDNTLYHLSEI